MAKAKSVYSCAQCGAQFPKWSGQCSECSAWNSLSELVVDAARDRRGGYAGAAGRAQVTALSQVGMLTETRYATGYTELDRVLGGGLVVGSVVLIGGDPGIGKSTLVLQVLAQLAAKHPVLYVTGEESLAQIASRGERLGVKLDGLRALTETQVSSILAAAQAERPQVMVIDSIQTLWLDELSSAPGSVAQVRESAARLTRYAKESGTALFLVGHVTKEGGIAGPRVLEHMVDAVLYFEGEAGSRYRLLRALKNRFGAVNEVGVFAMGERGLKEVSNPSAIFLSGALDTPGSVVMVTREGTRPLLVEVQALVDASPLANPRRVVVGIEGNRLALLLAVLHRHGGIALYDQDVFVNVVGGIRLNETAADLPVLLAVLSSFRAQRAPAQLVAFGEIGLSGELRPVPNGDERLREAAAQGFQCAIVPMANMPRSGKVGALKVIGAKRLDDAIEAFREHG